MVQKKANIFSPRRWPRKRSRAEQTVRLIEIRAFRGVLKDWYECVCVFVFVFVYLGIDRYTDMYVYIYICTDR